MRKIGNVLLLTLLVSTIVFGVAQLSSTHAAKLCLAVTVGCPTDIDPVFSKGCCYLNPCIAQLNGVDMLVPSTKYPVSLGRCPF